MRVRVWVNGIAWYAVVLVECWSVSSRRGFDLSAEVPRECTICVMLLSMGMLSIHVSTGMDSYVGEYEVHLGHAKWSVPYELIYTSKCVKVRI